MEHPIRNPPIGMTNKKQEELPKPWVETPLVESAALSKAAGWYAKKHLFLSHIPKPTIIVANINTLTHTTAASSSSSRTFNPPVRSSPEASATSCAPTSTPILRLPDRISTAPRAATPVLPASLPPRCCDAPRRWLSRGPHPSS